jgi:small conductance mechanosensitive channel
MVQEENMIEWLQNHGIRIALIILLGAILYIIVRKIVPRLVRRTITLRMKDKPESAITKRSRTISFVITNTLGVLIGVIVLFTVLADVGVNIGPALASLGILGLAVSFGAQSLIKDLINGLFILMENQFGIGDVVRVGGIAGLVEEINLRRTVLRDLDGIVHYVPNSEIGIASNFTKEYSRVNMNISVGYNEDLDRVIEVINRVCNTMAQEKEWKDKIIKTPQVLRVDALGDSGIDIKILGDTKPIMQWDIMGELRKRIKREFDNEGIEIPWPHMKVYFGNPLDTSKKGIA